METTAEDGDLVSTSAEFRSADMRYVIYWRPISAIMNDTRYVSSACILLQLFSIG